MSNVQCSEAAQIEEPDPFAERKAFVVDQIRAFAGFRTIRQTAIIFGISIPSLDKIARANGFSFVGQNGTSGVRVATSILHRERAHISSIVDRNLNSKNKGNVGTLDFDKISPELQARSKAKLEERHNSFCQYMISLSKTHTQEEALKLLGITPKHLGRYKYDLAIDFRPSKPVVQKRPKYKGTKLFVTGNKSRGSLTKLMRTYVIGDTVDLF